jgi:glyoxalase family protein
MGATRDRNQLQGLHHVTMITGDARRNVEFYADVLGLRFVKKTVNFDMPSVYHLYFGDEVGSPGSILTWFEYPGAARGQAGAGMIHTLRLGVGSTAALGFWDDRLRAHGYAPARAGEALRFQDFEGLGLELAVSAGDPPLRAEHPDVPPEHAIVGLSGARAYSAGVGPEVEMLTGTLGFTRTGDGEYRLDGEQRRFDWGYDQAPSSAGSLGPGTVHHIAWGSRDEDHVAWQSRLRETGAEVTDVRDRDYFQSIYFYEPAGVRFEIATLSPGFAKDEAPDRLGEELRLPAMHEHLRGELERSLTPVENPRAAQRARR